MSERSYSVIEVEQQDHTLIVRLNRPDKLNPISTDMISEITSVLRDSADDDSVRALILAGNGRAFSAGYDLGGLDEIPASVTALKQETAYIHRFVEELWAYPKPTIAAVHGYCLAGACEIAMLCDITIADEATKLGEPEIRFSSASPTLIMPWLVPMKVAKELLFSGDLITAQRAYEIGMINEIAPEGKVMQRALRRAAIISKVAPLGVRLTKEGINRTYEIQGLWNAINYHNQMAAMLDGTQTEELSLFMSIAKEKGLRAALDWRDAQFAEAEQLG